MVVLGSRELGEPWEVGASVVGFYLGGLLSGYEAILCLVPEGGSIIKSQFFNNNDVSECIHFHSARCRVPAEFAVVGVRVP